MHGRPVAGVAGGPDLRVGGQRKLIQSHGEDAQCRPSNGVDVKYKLYPGGTLRPKRRRERGGDGVLIHWFTHPDALHGEG